MTAQLLVHRFGADAAFEGQLVGALERVEADGPRQVLDVLFVARDGGGELFAIEAPRRPRRRDGRVAGAASGSTSRSAGAARGGRSADRGRS